MRLSTDINTTIVSASCLTVLLVGRWNVFTIILVFADIIEYVVIWNNFSFLKHPFQMSTKQSRDKADEAQSLDPEKGSTPHQRLHDPTPEDHVSDSNDKFIPVPPDGGYGWIIMLGSFIANVLVDGVCFCVGIFIIEFLDEFGESKAKTSWVGSVLNGMYLSMGPITSALATKFGCRAVTIAGSLVACSGFILSIFATNLNFVIFTFGGIGG